MRWVKKLILNNNPRLGDIFRSNQFHYLEHVEMRNTNVTVMQKLKLSNIKHLDASYSALTTFSDNSIEERLFLRSCNLTSFTFNTLHGLYELDLAGNRLSSLFATSLWYV